MAVFTSRRETFRLILDEDKALPADKQSVFLCRPLTAHQLDNISGMANVALDGTSVQIPTGNKRLALLKASLVGWSNYVDADGNEIPFEREKGRVLVYGVEVDRPPTDATLEWLNLDRFRELAEKIQEANRLSVDDQGN